MKAIKFTFLTVFFLVILQAGCNHRPDAEILISKIYNANFHDWLMQSGADLNLRDMYSVSADSIEYFLRQADGIIISGGEDVNPVLYGMEEEVGKCEDIDNRRDTLEIRMIRYAMENKVPLLCICRGCQILNVANGGTLIADIPTDFDTLIIHRGGTSKHWINISEYTLLYKICRTAGDTVNSYHHQAVKDVAASQHPFILGVQWHPEGMEFSHPLSGTIAIRFIEESIKKARSR
jgi:putative glutamine amidotransferase